MADIDFEKNMIRLNEIVSALSQDGATLDESLSMFEEGIRLIRDCRSKLDSVDQKVKVLVAGDASGMESVAQHADVRSLRQDPNDDNIQF